MGNSDGIFLQFYILIEIFIIINDAKVSVLILSVEKHNKTFICLYFISTFSYCNWDLFVFDVSKSGISQRSWLVNRTNDLLLDPNQTHQRRIKESHKWHHTPPDRSNSSSSSSHLQRSARSCHLITVLQHPSVKPLKRSYLALTPAEWEWKFSQLLTVTVVLLQQVPIGCDRSPSLISHQAGALGPTADRISGPPRPAESPRPITTN